MVKNFKVIKVYNYQRKFITPDQESTRLIFNTNRKNIDKLKQTSDFYSIFTEAFDIGVLRPSEQERFAFFIKTDGHAINFMLHSKKSYENEMEREDDNISDSDGDGDIDMESIEGSGDVSSEHTSSEQASYFSFAHLFGEDNSSEYVPSSTDDTIDSSDTDDDEDEEDENEFSLEDEFETYGYHTSFMSTHFTDFGIIRRNLINKHYKFINGIDLGSINMYACSRSEPHQAMRETNYKYNSKYYRKISRSDHFQAQRKRLTGHFTTFERTRVKRYAKDPSVFPVKSDHLLNIS